MSKAKYKEVDASTRRELAKSIRKAMADAGANYVHELRYAQAYLRCDYPLFHFVSARCQIYGTYYVKKLEVESITGIGRKTVDKLIDKLINMGFLKEVGDEYDKDIITVDVSGIEAFKCMCEDLTEREIVLMRKLIGDEYFPSRFRKHKSDIIGKRKPKNDKNEDTKIES